MSQDTIRGLLLTLTDIHGGAIILNTAFIAAIREAGPFTQIEYMGASGVPGQPHVMRQVNVRNSIAEIQIAIQIAT
jgi:hypothetical protein